MTYWQSPPIPPRVDHDALDYMVYQQFYDHAPVKTGNMRDHIDYTQTGPSTYWWDDCIYAGYQDEVTAYAGWWSSELPATWDRVVDQMTSDVYDSPDWLNKLIEGAL